MKIFSIALVLSLHGSVLSFNENINVNHYGSCEREIRSYNTGNILGFIKPHTYLYIPDLVNNEATSDEILRTKFYYRGLGDFSVAVSQHQTSEGPFFQTCESIITIWIKLSVIIAFSVIRYGVFNSNVFKNSLEKSVYALILLPSCKGITIALNMFSSVYYEELLLVVTKGKVHISEKSCLNTSSFSWRDDMACSKSKNTFFELLRSELTTHSIHFILWFCL